MPQNAGVQSLTVFAKELGPWTPDIDARRLEKPSIVSGRNFKDEPDGPISAWSSNVVNWNFWTEAERKKVTELRTDNDILYGMETGVWRINKVSGQMELLLPANVTEPFWPWTIALVGGLYYIAQYDIGLWQYDPTINSLAYITTLSGTKCRYVAECAGRLIYFSDHDIWVSALDNGTDFTPSLTTAAQAQPLSIIGGTPFRIEVLTDGFLVLTSNGILKATYTQAAYVFQYNPAKSHVKLFSPNGAMYVPKLGLITLDAAGFAITKNFNYQDEGVSQPWEILMGDYIKKNVLDGLDKSLRGTVQMYWSDAEQKLFISFSSNVREGVMITTFVWSFVTKKWMPMNHQHTGIFETYKAANNIFTCGYMATDGFMRAFSNADYSEDLPPSPTSMRDYLFRTEVQQQVIAEINASGVLYQLGTTDINGSDHNPNAYKDFIPTAGLFEINSTPYSDTLNDAANDPDMVIGGVILGGIFLNMDISGGVELFARGYSLPQIGIDSELVIGPYRFNDQVAAEETSAISEIIVGIAPATGFTVTEDWNLLSGTEDWNSLTGTEDWGAGSVNASRFDLTLRSSNDGVNAPYQGDEFLPIFQDKGSALYYSPIGYSGMYHYLTLDCMGPGESFSIKVVDLSGMLTGKLDALA